MESSSETRLPEANALPDGFFDSSADLAGAVAVVTSGRADLSGSADGEEALMAAAMGSEEAVTPPVAVHGGDDLDVSVASEVADCLRQIALSMDSPVVVSQADGGEMVNEDIPNASIFSTGQSASLKEDCLVEVAECSTNLKEQGEPKRKAVKRSSKGEKELLELTLKYQRAITERDSAIAVLERLESLCRELRRQNKLLMEECRRVSTEGQNMRLELSEKFNNAIKDVSAKLEEQKEECILQLKENEMLRSKLKDLADQYAIAEQQFSYKLKEKMLELELADLKVQQHQERSLQEQTQLQLYADQILQHMTTEKNLRLQLVADGERFKEFQDALTKSNEVFETYKQEMEKMVKRIKELQKENEFLRGKCEKSDIALVKLIEERESMKKQFDKIKSQKEKLESLCRSLQAERKQSQAGNSTERVPVLSDTLDPV